MIDHKAAVFVLLDSAELEKRRKMDGDTAYDAYAEDGAYYDYLADSVLQQKKLPVIHAVDYKYLKFVQKNGNAILVKIDTLPQLSTLYFFDPDKSPYNGDVIDIDDEYTNFFKKK